MKSIGIIAILGVFWVGHIINLSQTFKECIHTRKNYEAYQQIRERDSVLVSGIERFFLHSDCALVWADEKREAINAFSTVMIAFFTFTLWFSTHRLWKAGERQLDVARTSTKAAEAAVKQSVEMLDHAKATSERDLRPWLTLDAVLDSEVGKLHTLVDDDLAFSIKLTCTNIGRSAAQSIRYVVEAVDEEMIGRGISDWFNSLIKRAIMEASEESNYYYTDALAPSERHTSQRWCRILKREQATLWHQIPPGHRYYRIRIGIAVAYKTAGGSKVLYTAKLVPLGQATIPVFHDLLAARELPMGSPDCCIGPTIKALTN